MSPIRRMRAVRLATVLAGAAAVAALAAGCAGAEGDPTGPAPVVPFPAVHRAADIVRPWVTTSDGRFVDSAGTPVRLQGVDVPITKRVIYKRAVKLHANFVRIVAPWSLFEMRRPTGSVHHWNTAELKQLDAEVAFFQQHRINVLIDFHQFRWSPYFAGHNCQLRDCVARGIPTWYYQNGRYPDSASGVRDAEAAFWTTEAPSSQAAYAAFAEMMAARYARYPNVVGYEIINEPHPGTLGADATQTMLRWQVRIRNVLRTVDPTRTVFVMCNGGGNGVGTADLSVFGSLDHLALDWHDYYNGRNGGGLNASGNGWTPSWTATHNQATAAYTGSLANQQKVLSWPVKTARHWHVPLLIGEWGIHADSSGAAAYQSQMLVLFDRYGLSDARWELTAGGAGFSLLGKNAAATPLASQLAASWQPRTASK